MSGFLRAGDIVARIAVYSSAVRSNTEELAKGFFHRSGGLLRRLHTRITKSLRPLAVNKEFFHRLADLLRLQHTRITGLLRPVVEKWHASTVIALFVGIAISIAGFVAARNYFELATQQEFDRQAAHYVLVARKAVDRNVGTVSGIANMFSRPGGELNRWEFFDYAEKILPKFPGIQTLAWVPRVTDGNREAYERRAHEDGLYGFKISDRDQDGGLVTAARRAEYYPAYYVEPFEGNAEFLGIDLSNDSAFAAALVEARDSGKMVAAYGAQPEDVIAPPRLLMLVAPVYASGEPPRTVEDRRRQLTGFAVGRLAIGTLVNSTLELFTTPAWLDTYLIDELVKPGNRLIYYRPSPLRTEPVLPSTETEILNGLTSSATFQVADREWSVTVKPVPGKLVYNVGLVPWGVGAASLMLTGLLVMHMSTVRNRQRAIELAVVERTTELLEATASNVALEQEIRQRKRVERELRSAKDQADVANRAKSDFLAMVSHELRTPLNAVIGFSEMLIFETFGPVGDKRYAEYSEDIRDSGLHLLSLINNILDLSKVEANKFELNDRNVDITEIFEEALRLLQGRADSVGIEIKNNIPDSLPMVYGDDRALKQIIINLLSNAVKFTARDGSVDIGAMLADDGRLVLSIADTGIGIAEDDIKSIFKPFTQVDSSLARKYEGTGLGLPLTKSLVELHGGELEIKSEPGVGTTVCVYIPSERVITRSHAAE